MSESTLEAASVTDGPRRSSGGVPLLPGLAAVIGTGLVTWWAIGSQDTGVDHMFGPFGLPVWVEPTADALGVCLLALAITAVWAPGLRRGPRLAAGSVVLLMLNAAFLAASWRVLTAGVDGANIGGGLLLMVGPFVFALLLMPVVFIEIFRRGGPGMGALAAAASGGPAGRPDGAVPAGPG